MARFVPPAGTTALDRRPRASVATSMRAVRTRSGIFSCSKSTNEVNFLAQKLARVAFGTNNIDSCNRT